VVAQVVVHLDGDLEDLEDLEQQDKVMRVAAHREIMVITHGSLEQGEAVLEQLVEHQRQATLEMEVMVLLG